MSKCFKWHCDTFASLSRCSFMHCLFFFLRGIVWERCFRPQSFIWRWFLTSLCVLWLKLATIHRQKGRIRFKTWTCVCCFFFLSRCKHFLCWTCFFAFSLFLFDLHIYMHTSLFLLWSVFLSRRCHCRTQLRAFFFLYYFTVHPYLCAFLLTFSFRCCYLLSLCFAFVGLRSLPIVCKLQKFSYRYSHITSPKKKKKERGL